MTKNKYKKTKYKRRTKQSLAPCTVLTGFRTVKVKTESLIKENHQISVTTHAHTIRKRATIRLSIQQTSSQDCVCKCLCVNVCICVIPCVCVWPVNCHGDTGLPARISLWRLISHKPDRQTNTHSPSDTNMRTHCGIMCHLVSAIQQGLSLLGHTGRGTGGGSKTEKE